MLELINNTPFSSAYRPYLDINGDTQLSVVTKGTFNFGSSSSGLSIADKQHDIYDVNQLCELSKTIKYEADLAPFKRATDVIFNGRAYSANGDACEKSYCQLIVGETEKVLAVFGDRHWQNSSVGWAISAPSPFESLPLNYARAYGGVNRSDPQDEYEENPVGRGYVGKENTVIDGISALPNFENPQDLITHPRSQPLPWGFGFIDSRYPARRKFAGTYDTQWEAERMPLLPFDFDERYFNAASAGLILNQTLQHGDTIRGVNLSCDRHFEFFIPGIELQVITKMRGKTIVSAPELDTVIIEPESNEVQLIWRTKVKCYRNYLYTKNITVNWRTARG